eukprot:6215448-Amphidinium_carterae.1
MFARPNSQTPNPCDRSSLCNIGSPSGACAHYAKRSLIDHGLTVKVSVELLAPGQSPSSGLWDSVRRSATTAVSNDSDYN